tara:strand:- start:23603 stop:23815 length:213 start_codon:yes stop_codon:yes gene_type:complete
MGCANSTSKNDEKTKIKNSVYSEKVNDNNIIDEDILKWRPQIRKKVKTNYQKYRPRSEEEPELDDKIPKK